MKKLIKYIIIIIGILALCIIYLSTIGIETKKFNKQIKDEIYKKNNNLNLELNKIKLTLDPLNFKINTKTIGTKVIYKKKIIKLEYIKAQISLTSLLKKQLSTSNIKISTKSIKLKDLVALVRTVNNRPELFILESFIRSGYLIADLEFNLDENGKVKKDYKINGLLKNGKIKFLNKANFDKINFLFFISGNNFSFKDISLVTNNINFFSDNLDITKNKENYFVNGTINNKDSSLNSKLIEDVKKNFKKLDLKNINFDSKNKFSFNINNNLQVKELIVNSDIKINRSQYKTSNLIEQNLIDVNKIVYLKDHKIKAKYEKNKLSINGKGKIKLKNEFDIVSYKITEKGNNFDLFFNILFKKLNIRNKEFTKTFFPNIKEKINLKNHNVQINFKENNLSVIGSGKIQLENKPEQINYSIYKTKDKYNFDTTINIKDTLFKIDFLNYKKKIKDTVKLKILGNYLINDGVNLEKLSIISKNNNLLFGKILIDKENKIIDFDEIDLDYSDTYNKKNRLNIKKKKKDEYDVTGSIFNANSLISNLLKNKNDNQIQIFKNDINLFLNLSKVYFDNENIVKNLNGFISFRKKDVAQAEISALFSNDENLKFTINEKNGEKITTLYSSRAKPLVKRYKFIKGYEEGYLDFYSKKKDGISKSTLNIYDFKLQKLPVLTKLLTLASLQGIADLVSGEGIRFNEFEMNFTNKNNLMTIDEIYAIGPAISILMKGYVEQDKLISLKGTLVPATTLNKVIGSIPFLGKILVGSKKGEGVFGVSFKIKGPPNNLKTSVNPIKTLTPRFITRTLEKIK